MVFRKIVLSGSYLRKNTYITYSVATSGNVVKLTFFPSVGGLTSMDLFSAIKFFYCTRIFLQNWPNYLIKFFDGCRRRRSTHLDDLYIVKSLVTFYREHQPLIFYRNTSFTGLTLFGIAFLMKSGQFLVKTYLDPELTRWAHRLWKLIKNN